MNSVFGMAIYSVLSNFPDYYLGAYMTGQGVAGLFTSSLQIGCLAIGISSQESAVLYFCTGISVIAFSLISQILITYTSRYYQHNMDKYTEDVKNKSFSYKQAKSVFFKMWPSLAIMAAWILTVEPVHTGITSLVVSENEGLNEWTGDVTRDLVEF